MAALTPAQPAAPFDPISFFSGQTVGKGTLKELVGEERATSTRSIGRVDGEGWLLLEQKVEIEGDPVRTRRWRMKMVAPGKYRGTLSDAAGAVEAEVTGTSARIRYMLKGGIKVDQRLQLLAGGRAVANRVTFRKFGMKVATLVERIDKR
jgi:hypothetical protein